MNNLTPLNEKIYLMVAEIESLDKNLNFRTW